MMELHVYGFPDIQLIEELVIKFMQRQSYRLCGTTDTLYCQNL